MGLNVEIFRSNMGDCSNGGASSRVNRLCVLNIVGPDKPSAEAPAAVIVKRKPGNVVIVPADLTDRWAMFGGCFGFSSDSRFSEAVESLTGYPFRFPLAIHDRIEG
jgi:hypothetical protein